MRRRDDFDSRISQTAVDLFQLGRAMLAEGFADTSTEFYEVSLGLHRALGLRPWQLDILDFEIFDMKPPPVPNADWDLVHELHAQLVRACS